MAKPNSSWLLAHKLFERTRPDINSLPMFRPDLAGLHEYRHITVQWERELCPQCEKPIEISNEAAIDIETNSVFCLKCTKRFLIELNDQYLSNPSKFLNKRQEKEVQRCSEQMSLLPD